MPCSILLVSSLPFPQTAVTQWGRRSREPDAAGRTEGAPRGLSLSTSAA